MESLTMILEVVLTADVRCKECQKRITDVISRMNESVDVNMMEKKVTVICKYPNVGSPTRQITATCKNSLAKVALLRMVFCSSSSR